VDAFKSSSRKCLNMCCLLPTLSLACVTGETTWSRIIRD
jgi:hypothetical protein